MPIPARSVTPLFEVYDLPRSIAFYREVLGCEVVERAGNWWAMLKLGDATFMINGRYEEHDQPPRPDPARQIGHEDVELYFDCPDVDAAYAHLRDKEVEVRPPEKAPYGARRFYISDPDGFVLCFQQFE